MWETVVPIWIHRKRPLRIFAVGFADAVYLSRCYRLCVSMGTALGENARERSDWSAAVSAQIDAERNARNMSQAEVYRAAGIPRGTYQRLENGKRVPDMTRLARICGALGMKVSVLMQRAEERMTKP
jgi:DNA-binding XRE family transcriptional regulator